MADNISVKITADVTDLQAQFGVAKAESAAFTQELNNLARQAASTGLTDELKVQLDQAAESMLQAKAKVADLGTQLEAAQGDAKTFGAVMDETRSVLGEFGLALRVGEALHLGEDALSSAADIEHMSNVLGIATDELQGYRFAARESGVSTDDANTILRRFMNSMDQVQEGTGPAADAVAKLGLTADQLAGDPMAALQKIAVALLGVKDATAQAHDEQQIFGRSGEDVRAMLEKLAQPMDQLIQQAKDAGQFLDSHTVKGAEDAQVKFDELKTSVSNLLAEGIVDWIEGIGGAFDAVVGKINEATTAFENWMKARGLGANLKPIEDAQDAAFDAQLDARIAAMRAQEKKIHDALAPEMSALDAQIPRQIPMPDVTAPTINIVDEKHAEEQAAKAAEIARHLSDTIAQDAEQLSLKQISASNAANNFDLQTGQESLSLWKGYAEENADAKYDAEMGYLQKKAAADKGSVVAEQKDQDEMKAAYQAYADQLAEIDRQYTEKKRQQDQQALQNKTQENNSEYSDTVSKLNTEVADHQISAEKRAQAEIALATTFEQQELAMFDAAHVNADGLVTLTEQETKQRQAIIDAFNKRVETVDDQLTKEEAQKWTTLGNSIKSSFNSAIDGMLFQGKTFEQGMITIAQGVLKAFISMGEDIAEQWIETQIKALFTTQSTQEAAAVTEVSTQAGIAAATAYAQWAAFPPVADAMAGEAYAETMMWGLPKMATGAWELKGDIAAQLHKGEMVVPQDFASGLRSGQGFGGGGDINMHYGPTINAKEPATLSQMLTRESGEMLSWLNRQFRNGALRAA